MHYRLAFKNYLTGLISECRVMEVGVLQGTVLGPVLINIYLNDLFEIPTCWEILSNADDTIMFYKHDNWKDFKMTAEMDFIVMKKWSDHKLLTINTGKTYSCQFVSIKFRNENMTKKRSGDFQNSNL